MSRFFCALFILVFTHAHCQRQAYIFFQDSGPIEFASDKIRISLLKSGFNVTVNPDDDNLLTANSVTIILSTFDKETWIKSVADTLPRSRASLEAEGFSIQKLNGQHRTTIFVTGRDESGVMYGGLELAEILLMRGVEGVSDDTQNPYMKKRGVKMNIPLDVRTPSYTDMSDAAQQNITEMWSMDFWREYLDSLASYRFNFVSLWSLHPFPSLVKVPEYPDIALNDVHRSKAVFKEYYSTRAIGFDAPEIVNNYEIVKKISIDDKIKFWREVMEYAKDRNISFFIVTWNIYTYGTNGKYGITDDINNSVTKDYFRKSIRQLFITYPLLAGIGLTTGENMPGADFQAKENWSFDTYAQGVIDVAKIQPHRKITLIHRQHEAGALDIVKKFTPLIDNKNINFVFSFKYAQAHVYSATKQIHHHEFVKQIQETKKFKTLWTLRNDDVYYFRWGSPDFVREFIKNIPLDVSEGYYYGSDQYIWGRTFLDKYPNGKPELEIAKHWYQWMLWGRLGYNPDLTNERIINSLQCRFPNTNSRLLFDAWHSASMIYPLTTGFHYGALDFQWYIEASKSRPEPAQTASGFHDVHRFISLTPYKATDFISIPEFVRQRAQSTSMEGTTPFEVAEKIDATAEAALKGVESISSSGDDELYRTLEDIKAMSYLGKYYSHKINAATQLALYKADSSSSTAETAINELNISAFFWRQFASTALGSYKNPLWTNRVGYVDWRNLYQYVVKDIVDLQGEVQIPHMKTHAGGTILESESGRLENAEVYSELEGYTGDGYISSTKPGSKLTISYNADLPGKYVLEFRYISENTTAKTKVSIDDVPTTEITFWPGGTANNWVWDKAEATLSKGTHRLSLNLPDGISLDHINVYRR